MTDYYDLYIKWKNRALAAEKANRALSRDKAQLRCDIKKLRDNLKLQPTRNSIESELERILTKTP